MKKVYVAMIADLIHAGHIRLLKQAGERGEVTLGLLTDKAAGEIDDLPYLGYEKRLEALEGISHVARIIPQNEASYRNNLQALRPDYVVHGDDWADNHLRPYRNEVVQLLKQWGGTLIELPYSSDINELRIKDRISELGIGIGARLARLRRLIAAKPVVKVLEVHNALCGIIAEKCAVTNEQGAHESFDAMWSSSLTDSTSKGKPDIEAVDTSTRLATINEIFEVTTKPLIYDADTGGKVEHFELTLRSLERVGVSAAIVEDKTGLKKNSLLGNEVPQNQDSIEHFCEKLSRGKAALLGREFMLVARVESLILEAGMEDALRRASAYVEAGADGIMIHSRHKDPEEIFTFISRFRDANNHTPLVVVPSTFNSVTTDEFARRGVNVVIYANHMLRSAYPAMLQTAKSILQHKRSLEAEPLCHPISDILKLIPGAI